MSSALESIKTRPFTSPAYINGIYIPSFLLITGTFIVKQEWTPIAIALSVILSGWKIMNNEPHIILKPQKNPTGSANAGLQPKTLHTFPLESKTILSHNTAIYRFTLPTKRSILGLPTGQHISVNAKIPWSDKPDTVVSRSYTPISSDYNAGYFDLLIKAYPTGNISRYIAQLPIGGEIQISGPKGAMKYSKSMVRALGMIAGGSGITPMLQIAREIHRARKEGDRTEVDLIFANVNEGDILLKEDLDELAQKDSGFRVHYVLNSPPEGWTGGVGFVTKEMIAQWLPKPADDIKILVCGPPPMVKAMHRATEELGYQKARGYSKLEDQVFCF